MRRSVVHSREPLVPNAHDIFESIGLKIRNDFGSILGSAQWSNASSFAARSVHPAEHSRVIYKVTCFVPRLDVLKSMQCRSRFFQYREMDCVDLS